MRRTGGRWLKSVGGKKPDILFLDIRMPGLTGLEAAKELRKIHPGFESFPHCIP